MHVIRWRGISVQSSEQCSYILRHCFCPKMASEAISEHLISKISWGSMPPCPPTLALLCMHTYIHVTSLLKILAMGLRTIASAKPARMLQYNKHWLSIIFKLNYITKSVGMSTRNNSQAYAPNRGTHAHLSKRINKNVMLAIYNTPQKPRTSACKASQDHTCKRNIIWKDGVLQS